MLKLNGLAGESGAKGNKLLESVYCSILGDTQNAIAPFFFLYDLRLWADHSIGHERLIQVCQELGTPPDDYANILAAA